MICLQKACMREGFKLMQAMSQQGRCLRLPASATDLTR